MTRSLPKAWSTLAKGSTRLGEKNAYQLSGGAGGVGERSEHVEDGTHCHFPAGTDGVFHGSVMGRGEEEADTRFVDAARDPLRIGIESNARRLQDIGAARTPGNRAIAVFCDPDSGSGGDQGPGGGDVEGAASVATGSAGIDQAGSIDLHRGCQRAHDAGRGGDLRDRFALHSQSHEESADLRRGAFAGHDRLHDLAHLRPFQIPALDDGFDCRLDVHEVYGAVKMKRGWLRKGTGIPRLRFGPICDRRPIAS